jgi:hypothetical protein
MHEINSRYDVFCKGNKITRATIKFKIIYRTFSEEGRKQNMY